MKGDADISHFSTTWRLQQRRHRPEAGFLCHSLLPNTPWHSCLCKTLFEKLSEKLTGKSRTRTPEDRRFVIVFDNYQDVPEDSLFHGVINSGLSSIPQGLNVIVLRGADPPAYVRLRAEGEMSIVGWEDIRLTAEQSDSIARLKAGKDLESQTLSVCAKPPMDGSRGWYCCSKACESKILISSHPVISARGNLQLFSPLTFDRSSRDNKRIFA